jgi:DNA repair exonuclease SbcCD nuclease subunit
MGKIILYHGSPNKVVVPQFGFGEGKHDYGKGFYLTENIELAKEWAVCRPDETNGWVHKYELETDDLRILDFQKHNILSWLAELMKHRDASDSKRYKVLSKKFIAEYGIDTSEYDVIKGWRANASYFYIAKEFVRDNIDIEILEELLSLGGLGIQYCIKSELAYSKLTEVEDGPISVDYSEFNEKYNERDIIARKRMRELVDSDANKVTNVFSTLFER